MDHLAALGKKSLDFVLVGHGVLAPRKDAADVGQGFVVHHEPAAHSVGDGLACEVVRCRTEPAGGDDDVGTFDGSTEDVGDCVELVADRGVVEDTDTHLLQSQAEPLAVRVEKLAGGDFVAEGYDFCVHSVSDVLCVDGLGGGDVVGAADNGSAVGEDGDFVFVDAEAQEERVAGYFSNAVKTLG